MDRQVRLWAAMGAAVVVVVLVLVLHFFTRGGDSELLEGGPVANVANPVVIATPSPVPRPPMATPTRTSEPAATPALPPATPAIAVTPAATATPITKVRMIGIVTDAPALSSDLEFRAIVARNGMEEETSVAIVGDRFEFDAAPGDVCIGAVARFAVEDNSESLTLDALHVVVAPAGVTEHRFEVPMKGDATVEIIARTPSGQPIPGVEAMIMVTREFPEHRFRNLVQARPAPLTDRNGRVTTDVFTGQLYEFALSPIASVTLPYVQTETIQRSHEQMVEAEWKIEMTLQPKDIVWGEVLNMDGTPAAGAWVLLLDSSLNPLTLPDQMPIPISVQADKDGFFQLDLPVETGTTGTCLISARHDNAPGMALQAITYPSMEPLRLTMGPSPSGILPRLPTPEHQWIEVTLHVPGLADAVRIDLPEGNGFLFAADQDDGSGWAVSGFPLVRNAFLVRSESEMRRYTFEATPGTEPGWKLVALEGP